MSVPRVFGPFARWTRSFAFQRVSLREFIVGSVKNTRENINLVRGNLHGSLRGSLRKTSSRLYLWKAEHGLNSPSTSTGSSLLEKLRAWKSKN